MDEAERGVRAAERETEGSRDGGLVFEKNRDPSSIVLEGRQGDGGDAGGVVRKVRE